MIAEVLNTAYFFSYPPEAPSGLNLKELSLQSLKVKAFKSVQPLLIDCEIP